MSNLEKYNNVFLETFDVSKNNLKELKYQDVQSWDSIGHMNLIALLEEVFDIMLETDDIINFSSYDQGIEILSSNYYIDFK